MRCSVLVGILLLMALLQGCESQRPASSLVDGGADGRAFDTFTNTDTRSRPPGLDPMIPEPMLRPPEGGACDAIEFLPASADEQASCSDALLTCINAATSDADRGRCYEAQPPSCLSCVDASINYCADQNGCHNAFVALTCCLDDACPGGDTTCLREARENVCSGTDGGLTECLNAMVSSNACPFPEPTCFADQGAVCNQPRVAPAADDSEIRQCSSQLWSCLGAAESGDSAQACFQSQNAACNQCVNSQLLHCASNAGCDDELGRVECCLNTACPSGNDACLSAAFTGSCSFDNENFWSCASELINIGRCEYADPVCRR